MAKAWFTVKELFPKVFGIAEFDHNEKVISYLFVGKKNCLLFDSGMGIGDMKKEVMKISKLPIILINSHYHFDHVGGNKQFKNKKILKDKEILRISPFIFEAISVPGHTPDSICLLEKINGFLLTGDFLYPGPIYLYFKESNYKKYLQSFKKIIQKFKYVKHIFPGHNWFYLDKNTLPAVYKKIQEINTINSNIFDTGVSNITYLLKSKLD